MENETVTQPPTPELEGVGSKELLAAVAEEREWLERDHKKYQDAHSGEKCIDHTICIQTCDLLTRILKRAANDKVERRAPSTFSPTPGSEV
jgi:hypothetical protein